MKTWLIYTEQRDRSYNESEHVHKFDDERHVLEYIGEVASGQREGIDVIRICSIDMSTGSIKTLTPELQMMRFVLLEAV